MTIACPKCQTDIPTTLYSAGSAGQNSTAMPTYDVVPELDDIRSSERFGKLLKKLNLV